MDHIGAKWSILEHISAYWSIKLHSKQKYEVEKVHMYVKKLQVSILTVKQTLKARKSESNLAII